MVEMSLRFNQTTNQRVSEINWMNNDDKKQRLFSYQVYSIFDRLKGASSILFK